MDWIQIGWAIVLTLMLIYMFPRLKAAITNSPKGTSADWMQALLPIAAVLGFVLLLVQLV